VLDIWEGYFGHQIEWQFHADYERLELIPLIEWSNAQSGYGFLEFGYGRTEDGSIDHVNPHCLNFDVLAHELGHSFIFAEVGVPANEHEPAVDYGGMHESAGDLVAIVAALHFNSVLDYLLNQTSGNIFSVNELARIGELAEGREIRSAFNSLRMSDVGDESHERSQPLTGGIFDIMVEVFQNELVRRQLISQDLADQSTQGPSANVQNLTSIQKAFRKAYQGNEHGFKDALIAARDYLGHLLATTWSNLSLDHMTYFGILRELLRSDMQITQGLHQATIRSCFAWREIKPPSNSMLLRPRRMTDCGMPMLRTPRTPSPTAQRNIKKGRRK
jgi:hypothetical protein